MSEPEEVRPELWDQVIARIAAKRAAARERVKREKQCCEEEVKYGRDLYRAFEQLEGRTLAGELVATACFRGEAHAVVTLIRLVEHYTGWANTNGRERVLFLVQVKCDEPGDVRLLVDDEETDDVTVLNAAASIAEHYLDW